MGKRQSLTNLIKEDGKGRFSIGLLYREDNDGTSRVGRSSLSYSALWGRGAGASITNDDVMNKISREQQLPYEPAGASQQHLLVLVYDKI
jgi:hypothetical protein